MVTEEEQHRHNLRYALRTLVGYLNSAHDLLEEARKVGRDVRANHRGWPKGHSQTCFHAQEMVKGLSDHVWLQWRCASNALEALDGLERDKSDG